MPSTAEPEEGTARTFERTFTHEDVEQFGEVSGDQQSIHTEPDEQGRLTVQGLLTATLPTKIGGDLGVLAHTMEFEFIKPVYTGEPIICEVTTETVEERDDRYDIASSIVCHREDDIATKDDDHEDGIVLRGRFEGLIWKE